jgi:hypothetical protein
MNQYISSYKLKLSFYLITTVKYQNPVNFLYLLSYQTLSSSTIFLKLNCTHMCLYASELISQQTNVKLSPFSPYSSHITTCYIVRYIKKSG